MTAALYGLGTVALDTVGERPALLLQLLGLADLHAVLGHDRQRVRVERAGVAVEQHLHALADHLDGLLPRDVRHRRLVRHVLPHEGLREHAAEARGQRGRGEGRAEQVGRGEERLAVLVEARDEQVVPQGLELGAAVVHELGQVLVQAPGVEGVGRRLVGLVDAELRQVPVQVLHVRDVAAEADEGRVGEGADALDVGEAR